MGNKERPHLPADHVDDEKSGLARRPAEIRNSNRVSQPDRRLVAAQFTMRNPAKLIFIDSSKCARWHKRQRRRSSYKLSTTNNHPVIALHTVRGSDIDSLYAKKNQFSVKKG